MLTMATSPTNKPSQDPPKHGRWRTAGERKGPSTEVMGLTHKQAKALADSRKPKG